MDMAAVPGVKSVKFPLKSPLLDYIQNKFQVLDLETFVRSLLQNNKNCGALLISTSVTLTWNPYLIQRVSRERDAATARDTHNLHGTLQDVDRVRQCLVKIPNVTCELWTQRSNEGKAEMLQAIHNLLFKPGNMYIIIYYSGHGNLSGDWAISKASETNVEFVMLDDVLQIWQSVPMQFVQSLCTWHKPHLLIISDSCHSGTWVDKLKSFPQAVQNNISIVASCRAGETCTDSREGGDFTSHLLGRRDIALLFHPTYTVNVGQYLLTAMGLESVLMIESSGTHSLTISVRGFWYIESKIVCVSSQVGAGVNIEVMNDYVKWLNNAVMRHFTGSQQLLQRFKPIKWHRRSHEGYKEINEIFSHESIFFQHKILYFSGQTAAQGSGVTTMGSVVSVGDWIVGSLEYFRLDDILAHHSPQANNCFLIIVDAPHSGAWVDRLDLLHAIGQYKNISMIASCRADETSTGDQYGGDFTKFLIGVKQLSELQFHPQYTNDLKHMFRAF